MKPVNHEQLVRELLTMLSKDHLPSTESEAAQFLRSNAWNVSAAANSFFDTDGACWPSSEEVEMAELRAPPPSGSLSPTTKRPRSDQGNITEEEPTRNETLPAEKLPAERLAPMFESGPSALVDAVLSMERRMQALELNLPRTVVSAMPGAIADAELRREKERQTAEMAKANGTLLAQLDACTKLLDFAAVPGLRVNASENLIVCINCAALSSQAPEEVKRMNVTTGYFDGPCDRRAISNVRQTLKRHMLGEWHQWCTCEAAERSQRDERLQAAAVNVGKLVLQCVKEHDTDRSFERRVSTVHDLGVDVGSKNHSRKFVPRLRHSMHAVIVESLQTLLATPMAATKRPPPFAVAADKATVFRRTGQMHAIMVMVEGIITPIFASTLLSGDATGAGLAELLVSMLCDGKPLTLSKEQLRSQLTCLAFDGQYQSEAEGHTCGLAVQQHLTEQLSLNEKWLWSRWDGAHLIELAMAEVRKEIEFYFELAGWVSSMQSKYFYGKGHERALKTAEQLGKRLSAIGVVCTTRFCHSERTVYKRFFENLVVFIFDLEAQKASPRVADSPELLKAKNVSQVVLLAGVVDLLRHVKDLSLQLQAVNTLPWEHSELIASQMRLIGTLAADLSAGKYDRTTLVDGKQRPCFELLSKHMANFKKLRLVRYDADDKAAGECALVLPSALRASHRSGSASAAPIFAAAAGGAAAAAGGAGGGAQPSVEQQTLNAINQSLVALGKMALAMQTKLSKRLRPPAFQEAKLRHMLTSLDLRQMATSAAYEVPALVVQPGLGNRSPLGMLLEWLASRDDGRTGGVAEDVPAFDAVSAQFKELCKRLREANRERPYSERWRNASGVVIMKDVFTERRFFEGCEDYLHLFAHCALKTMNEAIVEGMGSVWDASADAVRHPSFEQSVEEAVIAWSAPQPYHAEAIPFINRALTHLFRSSDWSSHFSHVNQQISRVPAWASAGGKVVSGKKKEKPRLPASFYRT